ncbi:MAG: tRNA guanosine(34) transglycosylase Tgt [Candidatus Sungbacteria bacterium]|uniref:Queuine tRNA-ribosyltransferase n=1 Tax=Candidatus Sungiibacteriota bacterium TaxID=2750080 RepID=A0A9D6LS49_9BACT|nr:tRNA guanosine(34) transglycosylase Tgt [Candidatus Sungbacteria bacterium]
MSAVQFDITKEDPRSRARAAVLKTPHGEIETPAFVVVGTMASVRTLTPDEIKKAGSQVVLANAYHLYLENRHEVIAHAGGLAKFMRWDGPTMSDSGGFQVFSMGFGSDHGIGKNTPYFPGRDVPPDLSKTELEGPKKIKITEEGVTFQSPREGNLISLTPELSMEIQQAIGADMFFHFDECTSPLSSYEYTAAAVRRTTRWAKRCIDAKTRGDQALFGVIQGGVWEDLREKSTKEIMSLPFEGFGLGGPVGISRDDIKKVVGWMTELLPKEKPRHLLGMGSPKEIMDVIGAGVDLFDCVVPTREARNGTLYTNTGRLHIMNAEFRLDEAPLEENCGCSTCQTFTRSYLHHLFRAKELLAKRLATIHNLFFINSLVARAREALKSGNFPEFQQDFYAKAAYR